MIDLFRQREWRNAMHFSLQSELTFLIPEQNIHQLNINHNGSISDEFAGINILNPLDIIILDPVQALVFKGCERAIADDTLYNVIAYGTSRSLGGKRSTRVRNITSGFYVKQVSGKDLRCKDYRNVGRLKDFLRQLSNVNTFELLKHLNMSKKLMDITYVENRYSVIFNEAETIISNDNGRVIIFGDTELDGSMPSTHYGIDETIKLDNMVSSMLGIEFDSVEAFKKTNTYSYNLYYPRSHYYTLFINDDGELDIRPIGKDYEHFLTAGKETDVGYITVNDYSKEIKFDFINAADTLSKVGKKIAVIDIDYKDTCKSDLLKILIDELGGEKYIGGVKNYLIYYHRSKSGSINDTNFQLTGEYFFLEKGVQQLSTLLDLHLVKEAFNQQTTEV